MIIGSSNIQQLYIYQQWDSIGQTFAAHKQLGAALVTPVHRHRVLPIQHSFTALESVLQTTLEVGQSKSHYVLVFVDSAAFRRIMCQFWKRNRRTNNCCVRACVYHVAEVRGSCKFTSYVLQSSTRNCFEHRFSKKEFGINNIQTHTFNLDPSVSIATSRDSRLRRTTSQSHIHSLCTANINHRHSA